MKFSVVTSRVLAFFSPSQLALARALNDPLTQLLLVLGDRGKEGENKGAHTITYYRLTPGFAEKTVLGLIEGKIVCPKIARGVPR